jgi:molybdopterin molybdotransferase
MVTRSTPDAFAPPGDLMRTDEAVAALLAAISPVSACETVGLLESDGRVLAADVVARRTAPPLDNSAVDGYAVRTADLAAPEVRLPVGGRVAAGRVPDRPIRPGEAIRIFTGAPLPDGVDAVIPQELARPQDDAVWLPPIKPGANLRPAGEDFHAGTMVLAAGRRLSPQDCGHAAAAGHASLTVRRRPVVALFATGDEMREPGQPDEPGTIVNSNMYVLAGLVRRLGCEPRALGIVPDRPEALRAALAAAAESGADAILTTGGVSVGEEDHVKPVVESLGALHFWRIAIRPGRPLAFGRVGTVPFIGLPGNPVAAWVTFLMFARPALLHLAGAAPVPPQRFPVAAGFAFAKKPGRREWLRGTVRRGDDGRLVAERFPNEGSGIFTSVVASTGLIELPEGMGPVQPGDTVDYLPFSEVVG